MFKFYPNPGNLESDVIYSDDCDARCEVTLCKMLLEAAVMAEWNTQGREDVAAEVTLDTPLTIICLVLKHAPSSTCQHSVCLVNATILAKHGTLIT